ncbi:hypothetical protein E2C01_087138 [Portunus trituberculatus]|uniref:Uncharacterized protein n=1 Tax=Portunus trituberculatus TaxID=210409 RepID=A0A5B7JD96_PORTR|nr:hypothetical protein [Portunus trituberculatus]
MELATTKKEEYGSAREKGPAEGETEEESPPLRPSTPQGEKKTKQEAEPASSTSVGKDTSAPHDPATNHSCLACCRNSSVPESAKLDVKIAFINIFKRCTSLKQHTTHNTCQTPILTRTSIPSHHETKQHTHKKEDKSNKVKNTNEEKKKQKMETEHKMREKQQ